MSLQFPAKSVIIIGLMTTEGFRSIERGIPKEGLLISPDSLYKANHSEEADRRNLTWDQNKAQGKLFVVKACSDARMMIPMPEMIESLRSIAIGGEVAIEILKSNGNRFAVMATHVDGDTIMEGKKPSGCGGQGEVANLMKQAGTEDVASLKKEKVKGVQYYLIEKKIHPDPIIQAMREAREARDLSDKPTLGIIQDHRTCKIYPFAVFMKDYQILPRELDGIDSKYDISKIYSRGIPELNENVIPDIFSEFLEAGKVQFKGLLDKYPQLRDMQKVQNPRMIVASSKLPSLRIRYPEIADVPGIAFKMHIRREKENGKSSLSQRTIEDIINQAHYPVSHSVEHYGSPDLPFSQTDRYIVETSDIKGSELLANALAQEEWMKKWLTLPDHKMIVIQNQHGISNVIEWFKPEN